jgi:predicted Zn-dependent protease
MQAMAPRHALRMIGWVAAVAGAPAVVAPHGPLGVSLAFASASAVVLWAVVWLPRSAHAAFEAGQFAGATRRYWLIGRIAVSARRERGALLSRAGCAVATSRFDDAERLLGRVDAAVLDAAERAVWLNNRAYAALRRGDDARAALALVDEATVLRPDVPAIQHTRGLALLAVGRIDDAIAVLDSMRSAGELPPRLEAARCRELATAWDAKGEAAYAEDYRIRAQVHGA